MSKQISDERKSLYSIGMILIVIGFILFFSVFITGAMNFGNFNDFQARTQSSMFRAVGGMALIVIGKILQSIGAQGMAGSGVILDPEKAREELEPYSRMTGGMIKDALDEADIQFGSNLPEKVIMIKCRECGKLNDEDSKFCQECGKPV